MKKLIVLVTFLFLVISCKNGINSTTDSGLTTITMNDITDNLNAEMKKNNTTKDVTIEFVTLAISPKSNNGCSGEAKVPKTTVEKFNNDDNSKKFTLKTKNSSKETCLYTLKMQYGAKETAYFEGETTIGEGKNSYTGKDTKVYISLTFKPNGTKLDIPVADLETETNVQIIASIDGSAESSTSLQLKNLIRDYCKYIRDIEVFKSDEWNTTNKTLYSNAFLVQGSSSQCLNTELLTKHGFKENTEKSDITVFGPKNIYHMDLNGLTSNTNYTVVMFTLASDYKSNEAPLHFKRKGSDTFNVNSENFIGVSSYTFTYKSPTQVSFKEDDAKFSTRAFKK